MRIDPKLMRFYAKMSSAVLAKIVFLAIGYFAGLKLDHAMGTYPAFMFLGLLIALGLGIWWILWVAESEARKERASDQTPKN